MTGVAPRAWPGDVPFAGVLERAQAGDEDCFARLWSWLQPPLLGWLRVTSPGFEEEVAAETWMYVVRKLGSFRGDDGAFRSWVFTTARRRAVDAARRRRHAVSLEGGGPIDLTDGRHDPPAVLDEQWEGQRALEILSLLPPLQAQAVSLRVVAGLSVGEAAQALGKSEGALRVLCHRGLQTLAILMGPAPAETSGEAPLPVL